MTLRRSAYTLLELLVVTALVAALAALTLPALWRPAARHQLEAAAVELVGQLSDARQRAASQEQTLALYCEAGGSQYTLLASPPTGASGVDHRLGSVRRAFDRTGPADSLPVYGTAQRAGRPPAPDVASLPDGIWFALPSDAEDELPWELPPELDAAGGRWLAPVVFFADGRATARQIAIHSDDGYRITLQVRGITGSVQIGELERAELDEQDGRRKAASQPETEAPYEAF